ncbi:MAG: hypothetical protein GF388_05995 [Candidatus Aegiribacteria sp.]|nr:hypothetical protein [Candidatus Aegiribacteria sp.]
MEKTSKNVSKGMTRGFGRVLRRIGAMAAGFFAIRGALNKMPGVMRAMSSIGDVIFKNLLWPLRKRLMPILQRIADWVTDNRDTLIRIGETIVKVFQSVWKIIKAVFKVIRAVVRSFLKLVGLYKETTRDLGTILSMIQFKFALVANFIDLLADKMISGLQRFNRWAQENLIPVFEKIGNAFQTIWEKGLKPFGQGVGEGFKFFVPGLENLWGFSQKRLQGIKKQFGDLRNQDVFPELPDNFFSKIAGGAGKGLGGAFGIIAISLMATFSGVLTIVEGILIAINAVVDAVQATVEWLKDWRTHLKTVKNFFIDIKDALVDKIVGAFEKVKDWANQLKESMEPVADFFERIGEVLTEKVAPNIKDFFKNLFGIYTPNQGGRRMSTQPQADNSASNVVRPNLMSMQGQAGMTFGDMNFNITMNGTYGTEEEAREAGSIVADQIATDLRDYLLRTKELRGESAYAT